MRELNVELTTAGGVIDYGNKRAHMTYEMIDFFKSITKKKTAIVKVSPIPFNGSTGKLVHEYNGNRFGDDVAYYNASLSNGRKCRITMCLRGLRRILRGIPQEIYYQVL